MPSYHITVHDDGPEPCEGVERHKTMEAAHRSAVRSAVGLMLEAKVLNGSQEARVTVHDEATNVTRIVRVSLLVSHTIQREDATIG